MDMPLEVVSLLTGASLFAYVSVGVPLRKSTTFTYQFSNRWMTKPLTDSDLYQPWKQSSYIQSILAKFVLILN